MAETVDVRDELSQAILRLAQAAQPDSVSGKVILEYATAAEKFAEAAAWLTFPGQPHGGSSWSS